MACLRGLLAALLVVASLAGGRPALASTAELVRQLDQLSDAFPGGVGLWIADPMSTKPLYSRNADEPIIAASLYKLGILAEAERRVDTGELRYDDVITILDEDVTPDGSFEPAGTDLTVDEALEAMITISDNGSALALWHLLGGANVDATLQRAGIAAFHVAYDDSEDHVVTPRAVGTFFTLLATRRLISPAASDRMLARLERQEVNNRLPAALPDGVVIAHKTGNLAGVVHDAGIIYTPSGPRVVVAMTWDAYTEDADAFIANIGAVVYGATLEPPANARYSVPRTAVLADMASRIRVTMTVTNAGTSAWTASGPDSFGLIWEVRDDDGALVGSSSSPTLLPALAPSRSANVGVQITTPLAPGVFHVTVGLVDANRRALAALGAATATFDVKTHQPYLVSAKIAMPVALHRGEPSLLATRYVALATAGTAEHDLRLTWQAIDTRNGRVIEEGEQPVGTLTPGSGGTFYSAIVAPNIIGTYRLSYELREGDVAVSDTATSTVTIYGPRTYPDDQGGRALPTPSSPMPSPTATPRRRIPFPAPTTSFVPKVTLPALPTPIGKPAHSE